MSALPRLAPDLEGNAVRPRFKTDEVKVHFVDMEIKQGRYVASCNCNWTTRHQRIKVIEGRIDTHLEKVGGGIKPL